ncbi:MAG: class II aldolase/adducin family protein [Gammaproteobacteria bacterium]|nr:class II aldolase/adducin family protein [Gammaproteobacteria bacterium]
MNDYRSERTELLETARAMNQCGLNQGASGNLSLRVGDGFLITPSGLDYAQCSADSMVLMSMQGEWQGALKPSSEWRFHRDIYLKRAEAGAIVHAHPHWCTTLACLNLEIPAFHYMIAMAGGKTLRCASYATFGTQDLSDNILQALEDRKACLIANHGMIAFQTSLGKALALAVEIEHLAQVYSQCRMLGEPVILDDQEMDVILEKFKSYGNRA